MVGSGLYTFAIRLYGLGIRLVAPFHKKAGKWWLGRKNWKARIDQTCPGKPPVIWMHCASLGEFEQGRPVLERLKSLYPEQQTLVTFFSPSGYEVRHNHELIDLCFYLPLDTPANANAFLDRFDIRLALFVKYEFWYSFLSAINKRGIPLMLLSALFRKDQLFFKPYGGFFKKILFLFDHIFVQNQASAKLLTSVGYSAYSISGDTRVDRVAAIAERGVSYPEIERFCFDSKILVCGSTWPSDEQLLASLFTNIPIHWKFIIAPHNLSPEGINALEKRFGGAAIRYSEAEGKEMGAYRVLIIDNMGMLAYLYRFGDLAYIGGGFGKSIHNTLEAFVYGIPVIYGPKYRHFPEAVELAERGGGTPVYDLADLNKAFKKWQDEEAYAKGVKVINAYIQENIGATERTIRYLLNRVD